MSAPAESRDAMITALVLDVRGFTAFSHGATAREAMALVNELFAVVVPVLERHGGNANRLLGDGLLAVFGVPDALPDHADRAVEAAVEMAAAARRSLGARCRVGIGLNSGLVLAGTMGAGAIREFGVIGDPVNVAARVEQATRELGEDVLVTEATRCLLERNDGRLLPRGAIRAKGKPEPIAVYAVQAASGNDLRTPAA